MLGIILIFIGFLLTTNVPDDAPLKPSTVSGQQGAK
jgi:hypothetical protein